MDTTTSAPTNQHSSETATASRPPAARATDAVKVHGRGDTTVRALDGISIDIPTARMTAIMGPSGSGKSTLMHCLAGLDTLTSGTVHLGETDLAALSDRQRPRVVFADEPTGNLDSRSGAEVLQLIRTAVDTFGRTVVMVTHDAHAAAYADEVVFLADGRIVDRLVAPDTAGVLDAIPSPSPSPSDCASPRCCGPWGRHVDRC